MVVVVFKRKILLWPKCEIKMWQLNLKINFQFVQCVMASQSKHPVVSSFKLFIERILFTLEGTVVRAAWDCS